MRILSTCAVLSSLVTSVALAQPTSPRKELRLLGFADDRRNNILAYEVTTYPGDAGEAVVEHGFVDYGENSLLGVGTQHALVVGSGPEAEAFAVEKARSKGRNRGGGYSSWMFHLYRFGAKGTEIALGDMAGMPVSSTATVASLPLPAPFEGYSMQLSALVARSHLCNEYSQAGQPGEGLGFRLSLFRGDQDAVVLQADQDKGALPGSRGCPGSYSLEKAYSYVKAGKKYLVVFLKTTEPGHDMTETVKYFAVTGQVN
jgi:hypothetical protein